MEDDFTLNNNEFRDICIILGLMTLSWAWAETMLACIIGVINRQGHLKGYDDAPVSLKRKVSYFKLALRDIAALQPIQNDGRVLAKRFKELSLRRNNIVHGAASKFHERGFDATIMPVIRGNYLIQEHSFNKSDAIALEREIAELSNEAQGFLLRLIALLGTP
jgi:hypothetical protein